MEKNTVHKNKIINRIVGLSIIILLLITAYSCKEEFFHPMQKSIIEGDDSFQVWSDFQAYQMGIYHLQQKLADQMMVLGELRGDMVTLTENADADLIEIYNFNISQDNKYAQPDNFYSLIGSCNELISKIINKKPEVLDQYAPVDIYDLLYGEMQCMLAWAYFNAARIWKEVPYIPSYINSVEKVTNYIAKESVVIDSTNINFDFGGLYNDSLSSINPDTIYLSKQFISLDAVIDTFTTRLEGLKVDLNGRTAVGVDYSTDAEDPTFLITFWTPLSYQMLLGQLYFYAGDLYQARDCFMGMKDVENNINIMSNTGTVFRANNWKNIFNTLNRNEHIYVIWYNNNYKQQNNIQTLFSNRAGGSYMLKPSPYAVKLYESEFFEASWFYEPITGKEFMEKDWEGNIIAGNPGDFYRGYGVTYRYTKDGIAMSNEDVQTMLEFKKLGNYRQVNEIMHGVDTVVYKYDIGTAPFEKDAYYFIYRGASVTLYLAELYATVDIKRLNTNNLYSGTMRIAEGYLNDKVESVVTNGEPVFGDLGVRGRVFTYSGVSGGYAPILVSLSNAIHHPDNNSIIGYVNFGQGEKRKQQEYLLDKILDERGRELAFEGERFYDLVRIAKKTETPGKFLADKIAVGDRAYLHSNLLSEESWYLPWFD